MITPDTITERWYGRPGSGIRRMLEQLGGYDPDYQRVLWSATKERKEVWHRCESGTREWILSEVYPGREWRDRFMVAPGFLALVLGYQSEIPWAVSGVVSGGNPGAGNFVAANEIGGGLDMIGGAGASATGDYTAIQWGDDYPTMLRKSPHFKNTFSPVLLTTCFFFGGLVDNTRPAGMAAFALPDNGLFVYYDTAVDTNAHCIIRSGGVSVTDVAVAPPAPGGHRSLHVQTSDDGNSVRFILQGTAIVPWVDVSGAACAGLRAAQLQPYLAVGIRADNISRHLHLHDFRLIMDRGF